MSLRKYWYYFTSILTLLTRLNNPFFIIQIFLGMTEPGIKQIRVRQNSVVVKVRGKMDIWSVKEALLDKFYEKCGFKIQDGWNVIDIGAGIGEFCLEAALGRPAMNIHAYEPFPESYQLLNENLVLNNIATVKPHNIAIGAKNGKLALDLTGGEPLQFQSVSSPVSESESLVVDSISLEDALDQTGMDQCDLLKLDCEGAEYPILFNAPDQVFKRIQRIVMEYHDGVAQGDHSQMAVFLVNKGYKVSIFSNAVHQNIGYLRAHKA